MYIAEAGSKYQKSWIHPSPEKKALSGNFYANDQVSSGNQKVDIRWLGWTCRVTSIM